ncbi:NAD-dependent epimerase/dehydratase family protein [Vibrio cyclitrophicus]|uniref:NAD-dependent epimerase/dehydratase family protein n=1 Tax=Vibrio cyclitrophicus TaxID=47951 RepID=UPI0002ECD3E2|nr:NAD-dependent epimerase/dehydratase family protein [Vibrio cyclitrophicus]OEF27579.1 UDP-glucose 4-epimerase [Vibrio cyclitrophicus 1F97]OEF43699.1 UDP-glucose 4-epimerase [Vibrio cyclitrophicus 1F273]OEF75401.1 UDP-glucose 4-epimerase [Vibrio cyclitrophicus 1F111]
MPILVTGASGFVGRELTKLALDFRCVVRSDNQHTYKDTYVVPSIDGSTEWDGCFEQVDAIIHLAGLAHNKSVMECDYQSINTDGTLKLALKAAEEGVRRFVFVSSIGVNGTHTQEQPFLPTDDPKPHNAYAMSKYKAEIGLIDIANKTGLEVVIVRPTLVYGLGAPGNFGMLSQLVNKVPFLPFGLANNRRNFIAIQNLVDLLVTCAKHENAAGHIFLASDNEVTSTKLFTNAIANGYGKKVTQLPVPKSLMRFAGRLIGKSAMIEQLYGNLEVDSSNIKEILGWTPPFTMQQAMKDLLK